mgnify:CR=1 FL=1|jgi:uncharacterized protein YkwD
MTIRQLRLKHARGLRELDASYARRRAAIIKAQKAQMRERLSHKSPNNWKVPPRSRAAKYAKKWYGLLWKPLFSNRKKI